MYGFRSNHAPHNRGTKLCRNGPGCYHFSRGDCWFYHPPSHSEPQSNRGSNFNRDQEASQFQGSISQRRARMQRLTEQRVSRRDPFIQILQMIRQRQRQRQTLTRQAIRNQTLNRQPAQRLISDHVGSLERKKNIGSLKQDANLRCPVQCKLPTKIKWFFRRNKHIKIDKNLPSKYQICSICCSQYECEDLGSDNYVTEIFCKHSFHSGCIEKWFERKQSCPMCKKDFRDHEDYAEWDKDYKNHIEQKDPYAHRFLLPQFEPPVRRQVVVQPQPRTQSLWAQVSSEQEVDFEQNEPDFYFETQNWMDQYEDEHW